MADVGVHYGLDFGTFWAWEGEKGRTGKKRENEHGAEARRSFSRIEGVRNWTNNDPKPNFGHSVVEAQFGITFWEHFGVFWGPKVTQF